MNHHFEIDIVWSEKDGFYIATVPELSGVATDGATRQEALANAEQMIENLGQLAAATGTPLPAPKAIAA